MRHPIGRICLVLTLLLTLALPAAAEDQVVIHLTDGEVIEGVLLDLGSRTYRVKIGDTVREIPESAIKKVEFVPADTAKAVTITEALPGPGDFPPCFRDYWAQDADGALLESLLDKARQSTNDDSAHILRASEGLTGFARIEVKERERKALPIEMFVYRDAAAAEAAHRKMETIFRRLFEDPRWDKPGGDLYLAGNVVALVARSRATPMALEALATMLTERLAQLTGATPQRIVYEDRAELRPICLMIPDAWLPEGVGSADWPHPWLSSSRGDVSVGGYRYPVEGQGVVELTVTALAEDVDADAPEPDVDPNTVRALWKQGPLGVSLEVEGQVEPEIVEFFERFVEAELARWVGSREAERVDPLRHVSQQRYGAWLTERFLAGDPAILDRFQYPLPIGEYKSGGGEWILADRTRVADLLGDVPSKSRFDGAGLELVEAVTADTLLPDGSPALEHPQLDERLKDGGYCLKLQMSNENNGLTLYLQPDRRVAAIVSKD